MWDLRSTWRSTEIDPEFPSISHVIRWSDEFRRPRKPRNINDPISKFERVAGELRAKLRWGAVFSEVSRRHRSWSSLKLAGHKQPGLLRTTLSKQTVRKTQTPPLRSLLRPPHQWGRVAIVWFGASPRSLARPRHRPRALQPGPTSTPYTSHPSSPDPPPISHAIHSQLFQTLNSYRWNCNVSGLC